MIPKIIHYCWFGRGELPYLTKQCIQSWKTLLPDYELKVWNEDNFDIENAIPYVKDAYRLKKYAFVSDYVRLHALYHIGGIYLDTDVRVIKNLDCFLSHNSFLGFEDEDKVCTAVIGAAPKNKWILELLNIYHDKVFISLEGKLDLTTNVQLITGYLQQIGLITNGLRQKIKDDIHIYPNEYFSPKSWDKGKYKTSKDTYTIHYFAGTWHSIYVRILNRFLPKTLVTKIAGLKELILNRFRME